MTGDPPVVCERHPLEDAEAALVRLNRPDQLNPIDTAMLYALDGVLDDLLADAGVRVILVTGGRLR